MPEIMESESWIKTIRDPHAADFDFINASRSLIQLSSRSHVYIPVKIIESKLESESLEMLEVLLVLTSLVSRESDEKSREALSLQADNRLDFIKKLINLLLLDPHEKSVILKHYVDFVLEETDFYRIKLASKYLWPHLESCNLYESLQKCGHEKVIFILFHVWKDIDPTPLYSCKWYWEYLSECLSESLASGAIKRALYLLRESNKDNLEVKSSLWNEYVNLIESLDEKQVHIIKPVLSKLSSFEKAFAKDLKCSTCPFPDVFSSVRGILKLFFKMNILSPKSACVWNSVKDWIKYIPFGSEPCDATVHERVLLCLLQDDSKQYALEKFSTPLLESVSRPYAPPTNNFETFILYLNYTEKIISPQDVDQFSVILRRRLDKIAVVTDLFEGFSIYLEAFHKLFDSSNQEQFIIILCKDYVDDNDIIKKYIKMNFIGSMDKRVSSVSNDICKWVRGKFPDILLKDSRKVVNRHDQKLWGTLECNYLRSQWALLSHYCMDEEIDWISCALASIDIGGEDVMLSIAECFVNLLNQMEEEMIQHLPMETASYALSLLKSSESISIIADSLGHIFHENSFIVPTEWAAFIADMLIYGPIFRKDLALSMEVISMAMKDIETLNEDRFFPNIRVVGVKLAFLLPEKAQLIKLLWNQAIGGELEMRKRRHFENSSTHLIRNRAAQAILILMNELSPETTHLLFLNLIEEILNEDKSRQQQPSVKYLMEWMLSRILISNYDNLDFYDKFHDAYCVAKRTRLTVIPSFLVVFTQLALHVPSMKENILDIIAPWLMGQIFATRISAQIGFNRIQPKSEKWKTLSSCLDIALFQGDEEDKGNQAVETAHPNLILVASLIDKLPNLGGLCRTSEIFGIGGLVLNCIKSAEEKEFQNLSVSSQNWVKLIEVRKENLTQWLKSMKEKEGYNLIGIEQTAQSLNLYEYMFPEKTIFVLGNEKEGVCPDVLRELDTTIEIPQYGVIRSFNVHVTGALVLAEYVRQRKSSINT
ncbi:TRM3 [Lepeophtheirus salmonis]|uniref:TRM3 n=1 Tax=Lepeophtheirus salmonis TaxID=72036 RepID=A0A7R8CN90_LEPSM|nr:TRM3 [Lepeophtheirus salmonis]CAF2870840.1 TRM3 [Lepeophtheirus salmonis]